MQATGDIFLGWTQTADQNYYVRQLRDMKISADLSSMPQISLWRYAGYCAKTLARAHARAGNPVAIAAYLAGARISTKR